MQGPSSAPVFVACAFKEVAIAEAAIRALLDSGIEPASIAIGAAGSARQSAAQLAQGLGVRDDVDPDDPLAGAPGLASAAIGADNVNRGGVVGGAIGILTGAIVGFIPAVQLMPVDPHFRVLASALLGLIIGALAGATLGGALAPQRSTHAAFRIVDEIEHHGFAVVAAVDETTAAATSKLLTDAGGLHVMSVPGEQ